jgi:GntR family transcriptional regulator, arabinose operon transcriptional repressor
METLRKKQRLIKEPMTEPSFRLDLRDERPGQAKYERLKEHLVNEIVAGRLKPGQALPCERRLEKLLGVARMTIRQAMISLEGDGLIRRVAGKGNFVEADARRKLKRGLDIFALVVLETRGGYYPSLLHGFETAAHEIHHQAIICATDDDLERQSDIVLQLIDKGIGGVALNPTNQRPTPAYQVRQLQQRGIPVVLCHRGVEGVTAPLLSISFHEVGRLAGKALVERGHRRVAFFTTKGAYTARAYEDGLHEALWSGDSVAALETVYFDDQTPALLEEALWESLQRTFGRPDPPTAVFTSYDSIAEMIYLLLPRLGLRVPEDVSLIGEGGTWREGAIIRRLTSVVIDEVATGRKAVELLHEMRRGERPIEDNEEFVLPLDLYEGETLGMARRGHNGG